MARSRADKPLLPSVFDRLIDEDPGNTREAPKPRVQVLREMKAAVCRDLENLLNTRVRAGAVPPDLEELDVSLATYGIPDFAGTSGGSKEGREKLRQKVEATIKKFETRFINIRVELVENEDEFDRTMRFRIDALMHAEPAPEPMVFDSQLEPTISEFHVERSRRDLQR